MTNETPPHDFEINDLHTKALVILLHCYHNNRQTLTYSDLSLRMGIGEKTKRWQCVAWKDLKNGEFIVHSPADRKQIELSDKGVQLASTLASDEELAEFKAPETDAELHEKIKAKLQRDDKAKRYGPRILDYMLSPDYKPLNRNDLAAKFDTLADSHGFFYGLQKLRQLKYVVFCTDEEIAQMKAVSTHETAKETNEVSENESAEDSSSENSGEVDERPKKKYKSTKNRTGGKPLKLSDIAYVHPPVAAAAKPVTP